MYSFNFERFKFYINCLLEPVTCKVQPKVGHVIFILFPINCFLLSNRVLERVCKDESFHAIASSASWCTSSLSVRRFQKNTTWKQKLITCKRIHNLLCCISLLTLQNCKCCRLCSLALNEIRCWPLFSFLTCSLAKAEDTQSTYSQTCEACISMKAFSFANLLKHSSRHRQRQKLVKEKLKTSRSKLDAKSLLNTYKNIFHK